MHQAEIEVLALGLSRNHAVVLFERQAVSLARSLGVRTVGVTELLFAGTPDPAVLERRLRAFAALIDMKISSFAVLMDEVERRRR